jgi:hypothetical protein
MEATTMLVRPSDEAAVAACRAVLAEGGHPCDELVARHLGTTTAWVIRGIRERLQKAGGWPVTAAGPRSRLTPAQRELVLELAGSHPEADYNELAAHFRRASGRSIRRATLGMWVDRSQRAELVAIRGEHPELTDPEVARLAARTMRRPVPLGRALEWLGEAGRGDGPAFGAAPLTDFAAEVAGRKAQLDQARLGRADLAAAPLERLRALSTAELRRLTPAELAAADYGILRRLALRQLRRLLERKLPLAAASLAVIASACSAAERRAAAARIAAIAAPPAAAPVPADPGPVLLAFVAPGRREMAA